MRLLQNAFWTILSGIMASYATAPAFASRRGKDLVVPRSASLPANCLKCSVPASTPWRKTFFWHAPWLYIMILFPGLLIYAIVALIIRKRMELNLPLCETHHDDRKRYKLLTTFMLAGFVPVGLVLGIYVSDTVGWTTGLLMFVLGVVFLQLSSLGLRATKIDETEGVFRGACAEFLNALPEHP
jgi:hypothetical protein